MIELTTKQLNFVKNIALGLFPSEAYRNAGYSVKNMSKNSIAVEGNRLLKDPRISAAIAQRKKEILATEIWDRAKALSMLEQMATTSNQHIIYNKTSITVDENGKEVKEIIECFNPAAANSMVKAIEQANKMCGYNEPDKIEIDSNVNIIFGGAEKWAK